MGDADCLSREGVAGYPDDTKRETMKETGPAVAHSSSGPAWGVGGGLLPTPWPFGVQIERSPMIDDVRRTPRCR